MKKPVENIMGKGDNAGNQHCLLFPQCFIHFLDKFSFFFLNYIYFAVCKCFQFGHVQNFVDW